MRLDEAALQIGDPERYLDIRQPGAEDPESVEWINACVNDFDDEFDIRAIEEPEISRIARQRDSRTEAEIGR